MSCVTPSIASVPQAASFTVAAASSMFRRDWSALFALSSARSFFHVAPFLVSVLVFSELSRYLGDDQPLYGLQPQGLEGDDLHPYP